MAKPGLGTKRVCPETGRKFYDLDKDPIVSPYTGTSYPLSYFEGNSPAPEEEDKVEEKEIDGDEDEDAEMVSLEEADEEAKAPETGGIADDDDDDDDVDISGDDDTFLAADDDDDDDDVSDIIDVDNEDEE